MTPAERAEQIVAPYAHGRASVGAPQALAELIAEHIRQAILDERERICKVIRDRGTKNGIYCAIDPEKTIEAIQK